MALTIKIHIVFVSICQIKYHKKSVSSAPVICKKHILHTSSTLHTTSTINETILLITCLPVAIVTNYFKVF